MLLLVHKLINARKTCPDIYIQGSDAGLINFFYFKKNSILLFTKEIKYGTIST